MWQQLLIWPQTGGCIGSDGTPPPRAEKVRLEVTCSAENVNLWKKNVKDDLSLYPVFFSAVDRLELCLCY